MPMLWEPELKLYSKTMGYVFDRRNSKIGWHSSYAMRTVHCSYSVHSEKEQEEQQKDFKRICLEEKEARKFEVADANAERTAVMLKD